MKVQTPAEPQTQGPLSVFAGCSAQTSLSSYEKDSGRKSPENTSLAEAGTGKGSDRAAGETYTLAGSFYFEKLRP